MTVNLRSEQDLDKMRIAGRMAAEVLELIAEHVIPGVTTEELDQRCHRHIVEKLLITVKLTTNCVI